MLLIKLQVYMSGINFWSEHPSVQKVFALLGKNNLYENHNTTNNFLRATFTSVYSKLFKKFLTTVWSTKTGWEMTSRLKR